MNDQDFITALRSLGRSAEDSSAYCQPFLSVLPVSGAAVSTVGELLGSETLSASDETAARVDELQFDLGEGPCWDAMKSGRPVLEPDIRRDPQTVWPMFSQAISEENVGSLFAFPLLVGPLRIGAVDLYSVRPLTLDPEQAERATSVANIVSRYILRQAVRAVGDETEGVTNAYSRRLIQQATGMVLAQLRITPDDALLIIQGHAFALAQPMMDVAESIVDGRLSFVNSEAGIEAVE